MFFDLPGLGLSGPHHVVKVEWTGRRQLSPCPLVHTKNIFDPSFQVYQEQFYSRFQLTWNTEIQCSVLQCLYPFNDGRTLVVPEIQYLVLVLRTGSIPVLRVPGTWELGVGDQERRYLANVKVE